MELIIGRKRFDGWMIGVDSVVAKRSPETIKKLALAVMNRDVATGGHAVETDVLYAMVGIASDSV